MQPVLSREEMRALDRAAIERCGVPGLELMENAGLGAARDIARRIGSKRRVLVVCGLGNNGGDGFVVARHLRQSGHCVSVVLLGQRQRLHGDALTNADAWLEAGGEFHELPEGADPAAQVVKASLVEQLAATQVVVDAIFGTGLTRPVTGYHRAVIERINERRALTFALDVPSGLDADTGGMLGAQNEPNVAVRADVTYTFAHKKQGLLTDQAASITGEVVVVDIGIPPTLFAQTGNSAWQVEARDVIELLRSIPAPRHKSDAGKVLVVAGSPPTLGAARLAAHAALRAGAGLVKIATFAPAAAALQASNWEVMTSEIAATDLHGSLGAHVDWADSIVLGPGLGLDDAAREVMNFVVKRATKSVVVDADALTHFSKNLATLTHSHAALLLTPHSGEAARLLSVAESGASAAAVEADRFRAIAQLVQITSASVLLKGAYTLLGSPLLTDGKPVVNSSGTPALATGGSGDVLSGMLGALCCHLPAHQAAYVGAWLHGKCAEHWSSKTGHSRGMLAREIADALPFVVGELLRASDS